MNCIRRFLARLVSFEVAELEERCGGLEEVNSKQEHKIKQQEQHISELYIKLDHQNMLAGSGDSHQDEIKQGVMMSESTVVCTICGETVKCSARDDYYYNHAGMKLVCPECKEKYKCQSCDGKGKIFDDREHMSFPCKLCEGAGLVRTKEGVCAAQTKTAFLSGVGKRKLSSMTYEERNDYSNAHFNVHCGMGVKDHFAITKWFAERGFNVWDDK